MTIRFLADENFNRHIVNGLLRRSDSVDIVRVQDVGLRAADDPAVLEWAAEQGRVLLTHDVATMPDFAYTRLVEQKAMPGVLVIRRAVPVSTAIEQILLIHGATEAEEWEGIVAYLPNALR